MLPRKKQPQKGQRRKEKMKNYYIDRYIKLYNKNKLIQTERADRVQVQDEATGRALLMNKTPQAVENSNGLAMYESFIMITKNGDGQFKRYINEATPAGNIKYV